MQKTFYLTSTIMAIAGLWFLFDLGLKKLFLSAYRERLFELRFRLFEMGMSGELPFDSDAYRSLEILLNGLVRYAHKVTFLTYISTIRERKQAGSLEPSEFSRQLTKVVMSLSEQTQVKVNALLTDTSRAIVRYMGLTSPVFLVLGAVAELQQVAQSVRRLQQQTFVTVFEEEAYRAEERRELVAA